jgi:hypothetical protein
MKTIKKMNTCILAASVALLVSCGNDKPGQENQAVKTTIIADTVSRIALTDSLEKVFQRDLEEINTNLALIGEKEGLLAGPGGEKTIKQLPKKEEILRNIDMINTLLERNKNKMGELSKKLSHYRSENKKFNKQVKGLQDEIAQKEMDINGLKEQLQLKNFESDELNKKMSELQLENELLRDKSSKMDYALHKVYFAEGTFKELKENKVITNEGGILGVGKAERLSPDADKKYFTAFDTRELKSIPIHGRKAKLVTPHPKDSYELKAENKELAMLTIKDPDKFWEESKYLVVEVK